MAQQNGDARFDARRKQIVDGLMKCMQTKPYQKISIKEIAQAAAYLATASYVTGEVLRVDGGLAM